MSMQGRKNRQKRIKQSVTNCLKYGAYTLARLISPKTEQEVHRHLAKKFQSWKYTSKNTLSGCEVYQPKLK